MEEQGYLDLIKKILLEGEVRCGRNGNTHSLFGERLEFDLRTGFPLMTTKRVFWRGVVEELLWFLRGSTDATALSEKGVHIWDDNTTATFQASVGLGHLTPGQLGAGYGHQWRAFNGEYVAGVGTRPNTGVDQLRYILTELSTNPRGRRTVLSAWNPCQLTDAVLPPCHMMYEFYVHGIHGLSCMMIQRSADVCAGVVFNVASTSLLTSIIAHVLHMNVDRVIINMGDTHIYEAHVEGARTQVQREPFVKPKLVIHRPAPPKGSSVDQMIQWIETLKYEDFEIVDYKHHPTIKYAMIA